MFQKIRGVGVVVCLAVLLPYLVGRAAERLPLGESWKTASQSFFLGFAMLGAVYVFVQGDKDIWRTLGMRARKPLKEIGVGVLSVAAVYAVVLLVTGLVSLALPTRALTDATNAKEGAVRELAKIPMTIALPLALFAGTWEEIVFRGFLQSRLVQFARSRREVTLALTGSALLFGLGHLYQGPIGLLQTFVVGLAFAILANARRTILGCIAAHVFIDATSFIAMHLLHL